jgi:transcriptional regulator with XRE-family HTH domain
MSLRRNHPMPVASGAEMLRFFMEERDLTQRDLSEIGSQGVMSEILSGKREPNVRQIRALASRFDVSPAVFIWSRRSCSRTCWHKRELNQTSGRLDNSSMSSSAWLNVMRSARRA